MKTPRIRYDLLIENINLVNKYIPLHDSQALPPNDTAGSGFPLLLPLITPLLLFSVAGFGLLLKFQNIFSRIVNNLIKIITEIIGSNVDLLPNVLSI